MNKISDQEITAVSNKSHTTGENMMYVKNYITAEESDKSKLKMKNQQLNTSE
jgi:hypothetical protein